MTSINPQINELHESYRIALVTPALPLNAVRERWWYDALKEGMTPEDVRLVLEDRQKRIRAGVRNKECVLLRNICGSEEAISNVLEEAAMLRALSRKQVFVTGKVDVLKATGRPTDPETQQPKVAKDVMLRLVDEMKKAAG